MPNIILTGDLNMPQVDWSNTQNSGHQINLLKSLTDQFFIDQQVGKATRNNNILDLIFCHDDLISSLDIIDTSITDHRLLLVETNLPILKNAEINYNPPRSKLEELDFNKANWKEIRLQFERFLWFKELNNLGAEKCFLKLQRYLQQYLCVDLCPEKKRRSFPKSKFLRERKILMRRRTKL